MFQYNGATDQITSMCQPKLEGVYCTWAVGNTPVSCYELGQSVLPALHHNLGCCVNGHLIIKM